MLRDEIIPLNQQCIQTKLTNLHEIGGLYVVSTINSTNTYLKECMKQDPNFVTQEKPFRVILSEEQTAGRGRLGRSFYSPKGCGVYMSIAIHLPSIKLDVMEITTAAAVAIAHAIESSTKLSPQIKWVNDLYLNDRKICGILSEGVTSTSGEFTGVIVGIGINYLLVPEEIPEDLSSIIGALYQKETEFDVTIDRNTIAATILNNLCSICKYKKIDPSSQHTYIDDYRNRSMVIGKEIYVWQGSQKRKAYAIGIDEHGGLIIKEEDGSISTLCTGEITIRLAD